MPVRLRRVVLGIALGIVLAQPASADDATAALLADSLAAAGVTIAYDRVNGGPGGAIEISGFRATLPDGSNAAVPVVVLTGVVPREEGGFTAARIDFNDGTVTGPERTAQWAAASLEDVVVPPGAEVRTRPKIRPFARLSVTDAAAEGSGLPAPIAVGSFTFSSDEIDDEGPANLGFEARGLRLPIALAGNSIVSMMLTMMQYSEFVADVSLAAVYDSGADTAVLEDLTVDIDTVGRIVATGAASEFSIRAVTNPDEELAKEARAAARLDRARVRIENDGFVERLLDMQAGMLGGTRDDVRAQIVNGALPFLLSFVKDEAFRAEFRDAIAAFLEDPRSLTIVAEPAEPVPLGQVLRAATRAPMTLPDLLDPTVEANN